MEATAHYVEFVCVDCGDHVTRYGVLDFDEANPDRCMVCYFLYTNPRLTDEEKQKIREWGNGNVSEVTSNQREDTVSPDPDAVLPHPDLLGKPTSS